MHCLGSILGEERIEEIVEIIFFSEVIFHISFFHLSLGDGLAPLDLSVREGDR